MKSTVYDKLSKKKKEKERERERENPKGLPSGFLSRACFGFRFEVVPLAARESVCVLGNTSAYTVGRTNCLLAT